MSTPELPANRSAWPRNPYTLLGVNPGVSPRDLRRAYHALIRLYKPEHSPDEFRLVREAYESILHQSVLFEAINSDTEPAEPGESAESVPTPSTTLPPRPREEPWDLACQGKLSQAYERLLQAAERYPGGEESYVQLHWLLVVEPGLDPARAAVHWLVQGLLTAHGTYTLLQLIRRAVDAAPALVLGDDYARLLAPGAPPHALAFAAPIRSRAARKLGRFDVLVDDIEQMRPWAARLEESVWRRLLLTAATHAVWAEGSQSDAVEPFCREIENLGHGTLDVSDDLAEIDFMLEVSRAWRKLRHEQRSLGSLYRLLPLSWDEPVTVVFPLLRAYLAQAAPTPADALPHFDIIAFRSSALLAHLSNVLARMDLVPAIARESRPASTVSGALAPLLARSKWWDYPGFRVQLLTFCLEEAITPAEAAQAIGDQPELLIAADKHLGDLIRTDWPLAAAHQARHLIESYSGGSIP